MSTGLSQSLPEISNPNRRFACFKGVTPTRSLQHSHRRNANSMDIGIFRISSDPSCTKQNPTRPSTHRNIDNTLLFYTSVVSTSVGMLTGRIGNTKFNHMLSRSKGESPSISVEQKSYVSGMTGFLEELSLQGVSEETTQHIAKSRRESTLGNYVSVWKKWSDLCDSKKVDPLPCELCFRIFNLIILS